MVEVLLGKREVTSFAEEGTYGSFTNPTVIIKNARVEPQSSEDWQEILQAGSGVIYPTAQVGNKIRAFRLTYNPQDWRMLSFILGGSSLTDANPIYTHSYTGYDTDPVSFSLQRDIYASTHSVRKWNGCKVNTATLSWNIAGGGMTGRFVELALDCVAQDVSTATSASGSPSAASTDLFEAKHVQLTLNTSAVNELLSGTVVWENKLHDSMYADYASSGEISEPEPTVRRVSGTFLVHAQDNTFLDFQYNRVVVPGTNTLEFKRGTNDYLKLTFTNLRLTVPDTTTLDGPNIVDISWTADYAAAEVKDAISSYPDET